MSEPISMNTIIELGRSCWWFERAVNGTTLEVLRSAIKLIQEEMRTCSLPNTQAAFDVITTRTLTFDRNSGAIYASDLDHIRSIMMAVRSTMKLEATSKQMILLESGEAIERLKSSPISFNDTQQALAKETIRCFECGAFRASIVMTWNLAFDFIRQWAFDKQPAELKAALAKECPDGTAINDYADFFHKDAPTESQLIRAMGRQQVIGSPIIGGREQKAFEEHLRIRNEYAHANTKIPTFSKADSYLEHLLDLISAPPFC